jgi:hypothetical protein
LNLRRSRQNARNKNSWDRFECGINLKKPTEPAQIFSTAYDGLVAVTRAINPRR